MMQLEVYKPNQLELYMAEVKRFPLLTADEEKKTAIEYFTNKTLEAAEKLITANLRYVVKLAHKFKHLYNNIVDLVQEGNIGLCIAVKNYNPFKGHRFVLYARWWVEAYIREFIVRNKRIVRLGSTRNGRKLYKNICNRLNEDPSILAKELDVPEKEVIQMQVMLGRRDFELDAPILSHDGIDTGETNIMLLEDGGTNPEEIVIQADIYKKLHKFKETLEEKRRFIFDNRLLSDDPMTLDAVGSKFGISRERARQLEADIINKIKELDWN